MVEPRELPDDTPVTSSWDLTNSLLICAEKSTFLQQKITEVLALDGIRESGQIGEILILQGELIQHCQKQILGQLPVAGFRLEVELNKQINLLSVDGQQLKIARQFNTQQLRLQQMEARLQLIGEYVRQLQGIEP
jgi:hypothetical protein